MALQIERQRQRFAADPGDRAAFEALEEHSFLHGAWGELCTLYEQRLAAPELAERPRERAGLLLRLGQVLEERCQNPDRAMDHYREAMQLDPGLRAPVRQLRRLHSARGQWEVALQLAEVETQTRMRPYERAALLVEIAILWLHRLGDPATAAEYCRRALEEVPDQLDALTGLARCLEAQSAPEEAAAAWERALARLRGPDRAPALVARARALHALGRHDDALGHYREAIEEDPHCRDAIDALCARARAHGCWAELADLLERRFVATRGASRRGALALDAARLHLDRLGAPEAAARWLERAAELVPDDPSVAMLRAEVARRGGDPGAQALHLEQALELADAAAPGEADRSASDDAGPVPEPRVQPPPPEPLPFALGVADAEHPALEVDPAPESAAPALGGADAPAPTGAGAEPGRADAPDAIGTGDDPQALDTLMRALEATGRDDELAEVLERRAALAGADAEVQAEHLVRLARLHEERRNDLEAAHDAYQRAWELCPGLPGLAPALDRVLHKLGRDEAREALLLRALADAPAGEQPDLQCALGELRLEVTGDADGAREAFEAALRARPGHERAMAGLARVGAVTGDSAALLRAWENEARSTHDPERLGVLVREIVRAREALGEPELARPWAERWAEAAPRSADALATLVHLLEELGETEDLVEVLERRDAVLEGRERAANRRRLGFLHAAEGRLAEAAAAWRGALELDPDDIATLEALREGLEQDARHVEQAAVERRLAELLPPAQQAPCWDRLARLHAGPLGDVRAALEAIERAIALAGETPERRRLLESLLRRTRRFDSLFERLSARREQLEAGSPERAALDRERALLLLDELGRPAEAAALLRELVAQRPGDDALLAELDRAVEASGDPEARLVALEARLARTSDDAERAGLELERATVLEEDLDRLREARTLLAALAEGPESLDAVIRARERLERLYEREGDAAGLCAALEQRILRSAPGERVDLHVRAARLARERLGDLGRARYHLEAASRRDPDRPEPWRGLAELHQATGDTVALLAALEGELCTGPDREREHALRAQAAGLCAGPLGRSGRAAEHYARLLELDPAHGEALAFEANRLEREGDLETLAARLEAAIEATPAADRTALRLRVAALRLGPLEDPEGARAHLEAARSEAGPIPAVAAPLADLYEAREELGPLATLCRAVADACDDPAERGAWRVRLAHVLRRTGSLGAAAEAYRSALRDRPGDPEARAALREVLRALDDVESLARMLEDDLRRASGPEEASLRAELASLCEERLERPAEALTHHRRLLEMSPGDTRRLTHAIDLARRIGRLDEAIGLVDRALEQPALAAPRAAALWAQRGELLADAHGRQDDCLAALRRALELDPSLAGVRTTLREQLERLGRWADALDVLRDEAARAEGDARRALVERGARIAAEHVGAEAARPWLTELAAFDPERPEPWLRLVEALRETGDAHALERALAAAAERLPHGSQRRDLCLERGRLLLDRLDAPVRARAAFEEAYRLDPGHPPTGAALLALYETTGHDRERAELLEALADRTAGRESADLLARAALLRIERLGEPERATESLTRALGAAGLPTGARIELLRALGEAWRACGRHEARAKAAQEELALLDPERPVFDERRRALHRELAALLGDTLGRAEAAATHLRALLDAPVDPSTTVPPDAARERTALEDALLSILRACGSPVELAQRLEARLERTPEDADLWLELGRVREEKLWAPAAAAAAYARALELDPGCSDALRGLRRTAARAGDWATVARALEQEIDSVADAPAAERAALWRSLGEICWRRLGETARASRAFAAALEADPADRAALHALEALSEAVEDWRGAVELYERELALLGDTDSERRRELWLRLATLARERTGDGPAACAAFARADEIAPLEPAHRRMWAELLLAEGDLERHVQVFAQWCDDEASGACGDDHVRVAEALVRLGRAADARRRLERAVACDPDCAAAWRALAEQIEHCADDADAAARAWERAGELATGEAAAHAYQRAAELTAADDPDRAARLAARAADAQPSRLAAHALLARCAERVGRTAQARAAADRVLDLAAGGADAEADLIVQTALCGARAAAAAGRTALVLRFADAALALAPEQGEALALRAEARLLGGDRAGARADLERHLERAPDAIDRPRHLVLLAGVLEAEGARSEALARYDEALALDPERDEALEGRARTLEALGRPEEAAEAARAWAACASEGPVQAARLVRAAELASAAGAGTAMQESLLREAVAADSGAAEAWLALAQLLWRAERVDETLEVTAAALEHIERGTEQSELLTLRARALEQAGRAREAADTYRRVAELDPSASRAALSGARLLRTQGDWRGAAELLRDAAERHPDAREPAAGARLRVQLGRLLAGPLEDIEGAIAAYREALALAPEGVEAREALAQLLVHRPSLWDEATARHLELLAESPGRAASVRALVQIARGRGLARIEAGGLAILRALGAASGEEAAIAPATLPFQVAPRPALERGPCESLRQALVEAAPALADALGASRNPMPANDPDPLVAFRATRLAAEAELSAAALVPLGERDFADVVSALVQLAHEPETTHGDGHVLNALSGPVGRRLRRRLRRTLGEIDPKAAAELDLGRWRAALRALAAAVALDRTGGDLRSALCAIVAEERPDHSGGVLPPEADLTPWIAECSGAQELLGRVIRAWSAPLERRGGSRG